jgi:integrase
MKSPTLRLVPLKDHPRGYKYLIDLRAYRGPRRFFKEQKEARKALRHYEKLFVGHGKELLGIPDLEMRSILNARRWLWGRFKKTVADAVVHYAGYLEASEKSCTAVELVAELIAAKERDGASALHLADLRSRLGMFAEKFDGKPIATITTAELDDWLRSLPHSPVTRNHYRRLVVMAFHFAVQRGYAVQNPATKTASAKEPSRKIGILDVAQAARLLESAGPEVLPYIAIGLLAGLRRAEIERLDWSEIDFESDLIEVKAEKSKTAQRRHVTIQPTLREWLQPYRKLKGNVTPSPKILRAMFEKARERAGITDWPDNALRHSFASYHLAHFKNAASTALELGHHDSRVTFAHYRELVKPKEAARYWSIKPQALANVVSIEAAS